MTKGSDGHLYLNAANFNGGATTLTGTADSGDTVSMSVNGFGGYATVGSDGAWTYTVTGLTNGEKVLAIATASDPAGNFAVGQDLDFTVATTISESAIADAAVTKGSDGHLYLNAANFNGGATTLAGTADPGDTVSVSVNGFGGYATVGADGAWTYAVTGLTNGENVHAIATASDPAGNFAVGQDLDFTVATSISESAIADAAVTKGSDGRLYLNAANFNGGTITLTGTADAGDAVVVNVNGSNGVATVGANGVWTYALTGLTNGETVNAVATARDAAGNTVTSQAYDFTVESTISESAISDTAVTTGSDGHLYLNAANFNGGATTLAGTADPGDTVSVSVNGFGGYATVGADGAWTYAVTGLTNGENVHAIATASDPAGNFAVGQDLDFTVATSISESAIADAAVTKGSDGRLYLNAANFNGGTTTLTGTADAGDAVVVNVNGSNGVATVGANGVWTYALTGLTNGETVNAVATARDAAGNTVTSQAYDFTVEFDDHREPDFRRRGDQGQRRQALSQRRQLQRRNDHADRNRRRRRCGDRQRQRLHRRRERSGRRRLDLRGDGADQRRERERHRHRQRSRRQFRGRKLRLHGRIDDHREPISDAAVTKGSDGHLYLNAANFNGGTTTLTRTADAGDTVIVNVNGFTGDADGRRRRRLDLHADGADQRRERERHRHRQRSRRQCRGGSYDFTVESTITESPISDAAVTKGSDGKLYLNAANFNGGTTTLTGTADAGDTVIVNVNGFTGDATVGADGAWSYTVTGLTNGENVLAIATASDPAGNFAGGSYDFTVEFDDHREPDFRRGGDQGQRWPPLPQRRQLQRGNDHADRNRRRRRHGDRQRQRLHRRRSGRRRRRLELHGDGTDQRRERARHRHRQRSRRQFRGRKLRLHGRIRRSPRARFPTPR